MDDLDRKNPILADFAFHHPRLAKRLVRNPQSGCLEYLGPSRQIVGNPLLVIHGGKESIRLRRYIWTLHHGSPPKNRFVHMRCGNRLCHLPKHMVLQKTYTPYSPSPKEYRFQFDRHLLSVIRYYHGKASPLALAKVFHIPPRKIISIWHSEKLSRILPPHWHPESKVERRVEEAACRHGPGFYLSPPTLRRALREIRKSGLSPLVREIVESTLKGESNRSLARRLNRSKNGVLYIFRRGVLELEKELGHRRWLKICSRNRIALWRRSKYVGGAG